MTETKITRSLGIKYPIIGGTMMWISDADFVAAISNAGGLGVLASAMYDSREAFADDVDRIRALTDKPFAVNINLEACGADFPEILEVVSGQRAKKMYDEGDLDEGILSCGQGICFARDILPVKELFDRIISQAEEIRNKMKAA